MAADGSILIDTKLDSKDAEKAVSGLGSKLSGVAGGGLKMMTAGLAAAGAAIAGLSVASIKAYADFEQLNGGVETLFKGSADVVKKNADAAFATAGLSANQYMETVTSFSASLLQGLGGDTNKAASIADMAVRDMADNANKMGTDIGMIQNAYQGFAKDNFMMLDNLKLGFGGTAGEMARLVNEAIKLDPAAVGLEKGFTATAESVKEIPFDALISSIHVVQNEMGITGTTAKEASSTISGSIMSAGAAWQNVLTQLGTGNDEAVSTAMNGLVESAGNVITNISNILPNVLNGIVKVADKLIPTLLDVIIEGLPLLVNGASQLVTGLLNAIIDNMDNITVLFENLIPDIVNFFITGIPLFISAAIQLFTAVVKALASNLPIIIKNLVDMIVNFIIVELPKNIGMLIEAAILLFNGLLEGLLIALPTIIQALPKMIQMIVDVIIDNLPLIIEGIVTLIALLVQYLPEIIIALVDVMPQILMTLVIALIEAIPILYQGFAKIFQMLADAIPNLIQSLMNKMPEIMQKMQQGLLDNINKLIEAGKRMVEGIWEGISSMGGWLKDKFVGFIDDAVNSVKSALGIHSPSTLMRDLIGKNMALGIGVGWDSEMSGLRRMLQQDAASLTGAALTGSNYSYNIIQNFNVPTATPYQIEQASRRALYV